MNTLAMIASAAFGALATLLVVVANRHYDRLNRSDDVNDLKRRMDESEEERKVICFALSACLDGLIQLGANHNVSKAKDDLDKHLNRMAHRN